MKDPIKDKDQICSMIDEHLLRMLELTEEKVRSTVQMETLLRDGHIELAKAKYIRGKDSISILQVPGNEERIASLFELETNPPENESTSASFDISLKKDEIRDPVKWFGVLVPQNLRNAQKRFQESVYAAVRIANVQAELIAISDKLRSLYARKNKVTESEE